MPRATPRRSGRGWNRLALALIALALVFALLERRSELPSRARPPAEARERGDGGAGRIGEAPRLRDAGAARIVEAYRSGRSDFVVQASGVVRAVLRDDLDGSRHQRFIVELEDGHSVLVAHNIDLAPRVDALRRGDRISFKGEYEWNEKGGVIHWTHRDPAGRHPHGWIEHEGRRYQ